MEKFSECASFVIGCEAAFVAVAAATFMLVFSFNPHLAFTIGAGIALAYCLRLIYRWSKLQTSGIARSNIWQMLQPHELPHEASTIRRAQAKLEELILRVAKGASAVSIALCTAAFMVASG